MKLKDDRQVEQVKTNILKGRGELLSSSEPYLQLW
jgi:hypothetical protein